MNTKYTSTAANYSIVLLGTSHIQRVPGVHDADMEGDTTLLGASGLGDLVYQASSKDKI